VNINPILMCAKCKTPTLHIFIERRPTPRHPGDLPFIDCVYACDRCGRERVWGNEPREETAYGLRLAEEALAHAVDKHGMRREACPSCAGRDADCTKCGDDGKAWVFDQTAPCGPRCPLAGFEQGEHE